jgi:hypothetical protein
MLDHLSGKFTVDVKQARRSVWKRFDVALLVISTERRLQMNSKFISIRLSHNYSTAFAFLMKVSGVGILLLAISTTFSGFALAQSGVQAGGAAVASNSSASNDASPKSKTAGDKSGSLSSASADEAGASADEKAKDAAQNPLANTISIPFQNNTYYNVGPHKDAENALIVEPVIPFKLNADWNLITRTITPIIRVPGFLPNQGSVVGLGNIQPQFYFSPSRPGWGKIIWGIGPQLWLPTATDDRLGVNKFGGGPAAVVVTSRGHFLFGSLINNVWTGQNKEHQRVNQFTLNPFVFYNLQRGWYVLSSPVMTSDWTARPGQKWTVPVGGGMGRILKVGSQPINARVQFWKDVEQPKGGPSWTMQAQVQFLFIRK